MAGLGEAAGGTASWAAAKLATASSAEAVVRNFFMDKSFEDHFVSAVDAALAGRGRNGGRACTKSVPQDARGTETPILRARTRLEPVLKRAPAARVRKCARQGKARRPRQG